ncbi:NOL1/NOP2/sun family-domain-containing protein [Peziza echinospora]|nr:NOL1/NOP2/sun family-domain-containing protein [Peziza echinospora]
MGKGRSKYKQSRAAPLDAATIAKLKARKLEIGSIAPGIDHIPEHPNSKKRKAAAAAAAASSEPVEPVKKFKKTERAKQDAQEAKESLWAEGKRERALKGKDKLKVKKAEEKRREKEVPKKGRANDTQKLRSDLLGASDDEDDSDDFLDSGDEAAFDSDDNARSSRPIFSDDEDDSDAEEMLTAANIEGLSRQLDAKHQHHGDVKIFGALGADNEAEEQDLLAPDIHLIRTRITDTIRVLESFSTLAEAGRSRAEYTAQLLKDICAYYGYSPYLAENSSTSSPPPKPSPSSRQTRSNVLSSSAQTPSKPPAETLAQALINRGRHPRARRKMVQSRPPDLRGPRPPSAQHQSISQETTSCKPPPRSSPSWPSRPRKTSASSTWPPPPAVKTTYISALMKNTGCVFANDANKARTKGLIGNIHRLGIKNTIVCNHDAREFPKLIGGFDRVLLDAPCSGTGVISKDPSVKTNKTEKDFLQLPHLQKQLLLAAIDSVDHASATGGVYRVLDVLRHRRRERGRRAVRAPHAAQRQARRDGADVWPRGLVSFRGKTFDRKMNLTRRYYPHMYNVDGFFVAKFKKTGPSPKTGPGVSAGKTDGAPRAGGNDLDGDEVDLGAADEFAEFGGNEEEDRVYMEKGRGADEEEGQESGCGSE